MDNWRINQLVGEHLFGRWPSMRGAGVATMDYTGTGDGMLMVVEGMRQRGLWLIVVRHQTGYEVAFYDPDGRKGQPNVNTSEHPGHEWDLPWAVDLAALKTLKIEVPA